MRLPGTARREATPQAAAAAAAAAARRTRGLAPPPPPGRAGCRAPRLGVSRRRRFHRRRCRRRRRPGERGERRLLAPAAPDVNAQVPARQRECAASGGRRLRPGSPGREGGRAPQPLEQARARHVPGRRPGPLRWGATRGPTGEAGTLLGRLGPPAVRVPGQDGVEGRPRCPGSARAGGAGAERGGAAGKEEETRPRGSRKAWRLPLGSALVVSPGPGRAGEEEELGGSAPWRSWGSFLRKCAFPLLSCSRPPRAPPPTSFHSPLLLVTGI